MIIYYYYILNFDWSLINILTISLISSINHRIWLLLPIMILEALQLYWSLKMQRTKKIYVSIIHLFNIFDKQCFCIVCEKSTLKKIELKNVLESNVDLLKFFTKRSFGPLIQTQKDLVIYDYHCNYVNIEFVLYNHLSNHCRCLFLQRTSRKNITCPNKERCLKRGEVLDLLGRFSVYTTPRYGVLASRQNWTQLGQN